MAENLSVIGVYSYLDEVVEALSTLKREGIFIDTVYSPIPSHEIRETLGLSELGTVRFYTLTGAILGILTGLFLAWYTAAQWHFIVGGKPTIPWIPSVIPAFEFLILIAVFFNLGGLLHKIGMPRLRLPSHFDPRFTQDRFGILVKCAEEQRETVFNILMNSGAEEVRRVEQ